jgi:hypothetical protein
MARLRTWLLLGLCGAGAPLGLSQSTSAQIAQPAAPRASTSPTPQGTATKGEGPSRQEVLLLRTLAANPITAPYTFMTSRRGKDVMLWGRVGTKVVHDVAVRTAIDLGVHIDDQLVIDTAETYRAAAMASMPQVPPGAVAAGANMGPNANMYAGAGGMAPAGGMIPGANASLTAMGIGPPPYVYPPPLFGRYDDPFFGFEPPLATFPPWWGLMSRRRLADIAAINAQQAAQAQGAAANGNANANPNPNPGEAAPAATAADLPIGVVEMTIDSRGVAVLQGTVGTLEEKIAVGQRIAQSPQVAEVINLIKIGSSRPAAGADAPPPPAPHPPDREEPAPAPAAIVPDGAGEPASPVADRILKALSKRPDLARLPIKVAVRDGVATLEGKVPGAFEAMLAYRAAEQTPGVHAVDDRLEFSVPDDDRKNPLLKKGRPEDVEPYLAAQIRRQVGDRAHVDRVRLNGDRLDVRGTLDDPDARAQVEAILRSMPVLRGFQLDMQFVAD